MLWQVNVVSEENVPWWQHSLQGDYYPWFIILIHCGGLRISCLQLISSSHSLSALCSSFYLSPPLLPFSSLCPASANPTSQMLYPRNLMEVIWLPINRADRGKTPGQYTTVPIMLNSGCMGKKSPRGFRLFGNSSWRGKHKTHFWGVSQKCGINILYFVMPVQHFQLNHASWCNKRKDIGFGLDTYYFHCFVTAAASSLMNATESDNCASGWRLPAGQGSNSMVWAQIEDVIWGLRPKLIKLTL